MAVYRNRGAPWRRKNGTVVARGAEFVPTDDELRRRRHKLVYLRPTGDGDALEDPTADFRVEDYAVGGGYYMIRGRRVHGRTEALALMRK